MANVDAVTVIEIGDLVYQDIDDVKPACSLAARSSETANQELFAEDFLGVAMQRSRSGDSDRIWVATRGVFEFEYVGRPAERDTPMIPIVSSDGKSLENQTVTVAASVSRSIGLVAGKGKWTVLGERTVLVDIHAPEKTEA